MTILYYKKGSVSSVYTVNPINAGAKTPRIQTLRATPTQGTGKKGVGRIGITLETIGAKKPAEAGFRRRRLAPPLGLCQEDFLTSFQRLDCIIGIEVDFVFFRPFDAVDHFLAFF